MLTIRAAACGDVIVSPKTDRTSLALGWEAAKANAVPAFILQGAMLAILISYYVSPACADLLNRLAHYKEQHGLVFVVGAAILAGAIVPELFVIVFFQRGRLRTQNLRNLAFTIPTWGIDGILVDLMYRLNAVWFGDVVTVPVVIAKILVDQLGYNPFIAAPARGARLRMEKRRLLVEIGPPRADLGSLPRQDRPDVARHLGGLGAAHGDNLFAALPVAVSALQHRPHFLGAAPHLHDESVCRKN